MWSLDQSTSTYTSSEAPRGKRRARERRTHRSETHSATVGAYNDVGASSGARGHRGRPHCAPPSPVSATGPPIPISNCSSYDPLAICISGLSLSPFHGFDAENRGHLISCELHLDITIASTIALTPRVPPLTIPCFQCL